MTTDWQMAMRVFTTCAARGEFSSHLVRSSSFVFFRIICLQQKMNSPSLEAMLGGQNSHETDSFIDSYADTDTVVVLKNGTTLPLFGGNPLLTPLNYSFLDETSNDQVGDF